MKTLIKTGLANILIIGLLSFSSCISDDPGPLQYGEREFSADNFTRLDVSSASLGKVTVSTKLEATLTGTSTVRYRGNPPIYPNVSGGSSLHMD